MNMKDFDLNNLDFQRVGAWPTPVKAVACALIFALIVGFGWWWKVNDKRAELRGLEATEQELLQQFEYKQSKVVNLEAYKAQLEEMKEILRQMLRQLPSKTEMPDLLVDVSQTALSTGIDNQKFEPGAETVKDFYAEKPINLRMVGDYHQFGSFVSGVASLPRVVILTMHDISLKPQAADAKTGLVSGPLVLEGTVKTYRYVDENEAAAVPADPAQAGGSP
ncbi:MAG TPA: type 4a pilus biogenesis protein PilO [Pseudomonadota bacterium]|nr:type 4a pilus biogenesis protein PilO [Pseudomonadota bacterium]HQY36475.1 type 4a pilus biogenesis protein PilO [Pseudomonadota bacterium]HRA37651.1 type 4a pilus biogenesis protein PilO [Pseudomonadota bacterium]